MLKKGIRKELVRPLSLSTGHKIIVCKFMNIYPLMCEALISLPTSEETSGEVSDLPRGL